MSVVLVTAGTGTFGSSLVPNLTARKHDVRPGFGRRLARAPGSIRGSIPHGGISS